MSVDGGTELTGIMGYPIDYTLSPVIHNAGFRSLGINWIYVPLRVPPGRVGAAVEGLRALGFRGFNVTIPYKVEIGRYLDGLRGEAELTGAVNTVVNEEGGLFGYNTDVEGFLAFLAEEGIETQGSSVLIIGAGGASRAVAIAVASGGASRIFIMNRTLKRANELASLLKRVTPVTEISVRTFDVKSSRVLGECSMVINCTPLEGSEGGDLPLDYEGFSADIWAIDLNYVAPETSFLRMSSERGAKTADGAGMLLHQAAASFRLWTGQSPPLAEMRKAFKRATKGS